MKKIIFETDLLPDGHLYCPAEFVGKKNIHFDIIVTFDSLEETSDSDVEFYQRNAFMQSAGSWADLNTDMLKEQIYSDRKFSSRKMGDL